MTETHEAQFIHREIVVEERVVYQLVSDQGYIEHSPDS